MHTCGDQPFSFAFWRCLLMECTHKKPQCWIVMECTHKNSLCMKPDNSQSSIPGSKFEGSAMIGGRIIESPSGKDLQDHHVQPLTWKKPYNLLLNFNPTAGTETDLGHSLWKANTLSLLAFQSQQCFMNFMLQRNITAIKNPYPYLLPKVWRLDKIPLSCERLPNSIDSDTTSNSN